MDFASSLSLAPMATEQLAVADAQNPVEPSSSGLVASATRDEEAVNRKLDITECIKVAMRKCQGEIEQARVSDEPVVIHKGLAAEEILNLLGRLVDLRWSSVLKSEIEAVVGGEQLDLRQRMELSWKNNLITKLSKAEVHLKEFIETLVTVDAPPVIHVEHQRTRPGFAPVMVSSDSYVQANACATPMSKEQPVVNDMVSKPGPMPVKPLLLHETCEPQVATPIPVAPPSSQEVNTASMETVDEESSPPDSANKEPPDPVFRAAHRKLKPAKNGRVVPTKLTNLDVPRGRGGVINRHAGHQFLLSRVCTYRDRYKAAKRGEKEILAKQLVREIQERNGRFLDYLLNEDGEKIWYEIDDEAAIKVVQQKLRELPVRVKDKWRGSESDEASGGQEGGDRAGYRQDQLTPHVAQGGQKREAKGEHEAAMMLLSL